MIYLSDLRKLGYCAKGTKAFFESHELDWKNFVKNGIEEEKLKATNDAMAIKLAEVNNGR